MATTPILPDGESVSQSSMPTMAGGARRPAGPVDDATAGSMKTMRGRTTPRGGRLRPGDVLLGRYTVLSELGEGGMGVVYKCLDKVGGIEVALKCLPPELSRNEAEMEGIRENYAIVAKLHHSAISGLRQLEKDPDFGEYYLVMDLARGEDLSAILRRRRGEAMPPAEALAILRPLASALDYAHGEKVLHRDVKPANVKVDGPRVQLLDFGLAAEVRSSLSRVSLRGHAGSSGTPAYMAPEQWEAMRQSAATDQYSLAVMAYQMLAGFLPFDADDTDLLRRAVLSRAPEPVSGLSRAANAALLRALAKDPGARFPSCIAFVDALERALCAPRRHAGAKWFIASAVAVAVAGVYFTQSSQRPQTESHAEFAESAASESHAESAESAASESHAEFAESAGDGSKVRTSTAPEPASVEHPVSSAPSGRSDLTGSPDKPVLTPATASVADLRTTQASFADALDEREAARIEENAAAIKAEKNHIAREKAAAEKKAREESERKAEAERKAREEDERKISEVAEGRKAGDRMTVRVGSREVALRWCPPGSFMMGSPESEDGRGSDETQRRVVLTKGFWMGETEVTQGLWKEVAGNNPSYFKSGDNYPVERVSWDDSQEFVKKLNFRHAQTGFRWALPTEAQWEYACRAGTTTALPNGKDIEILGQNNAPALDDIAWYGGNSSVDWHGMNGIDCSDWSERQYSGSMAGTHPVGRKNMNKWGFYDMIGNVWEWCSDRYDEHPVGAATDPVGPVSGANRVLRGGSWRHSANGCKSASRSGSAHDFSDDFIGFRVALVPDLGKVEDSKPEEETGKNLKTIWVVRATLGGSAVSGATLSLGGKTYTLPVRLSLQDGKKYGPGEVTLEKDGKTYVGTLAKTTVDWKGEKSATVVLEERKAADGGAHSPNGAPRRNESHRAGDRVTVRVGSQKVALRWCPPGTFAMGSSEDEEGHVNVHDTETTHRVTLTKGFWMGETEVTQGLWKEFTGINPSQNKPGDDYPVEQVSWNDCQEFLKKLNKQAPKGWIFTLPTEAQWEYACRAGSTGVFSGTGVLDEMGWYEANSENGTHPVSMKQPNAWGLRDMHGNVLEWCADGSGPYPSNAVIDPVGPSNGTCRILRGGCFWMSDSECRSAKRSWRLPEERFGFTGLRLVAFDRDDR